MFGIKGRDTFNKPQSDFALFFGFVRRKWTKIFPIVLSLILVCILSFVWYVWYAFVHTKELTGAEKTDYVNQKKSEVTFDKKRFDAVKDRIVQRNDFYTRNRQDFRDIFYRQ
jgi:phosphotransferase system  glucose/maltose/N-acetylglucosamine-specific IIC component